MGERGGLSRTIALAALAGALAWNPPAVALEAADTAADAPSEEPFYHTVESGETLSAIADRYGTSVASLIRENEIDDPSNVWAGVKLLIPASARRIPALDVAPKVDASAPESTEIAASLDRCEADLRAAYFERALECAAEVRARLDARKNAGDGAARVRLEIASATSNVALGRTEAALESFERALIADPDLELDPALTSPKVLGVFRAARRRGSPPQ